MERTDLVVTALSEAELREEIAKQAVIKAKIVANIDSLEQELARRTAKRAVGERVKVPCYREPNLFEITEIHSRNGRPIYLGRKVCKDGRLGKNLQELYLK